MALRFGKYEGIGNDFVVVDAESETALGSEQARKLCDRHYGVGGDGVLLSAPPVTPGAHGRMVVLNSDGSRPEGCGNGLRCVALGQLAPAYVDGFVALVPVQPSPALQALAARCVTELDALRAPITAADRERRKMDPHDQRGNALFERFGYPYVLERFRFHMTLTGPVDAVLGDQLVAQLARPVAQLNAHEPPVLDRLCLFVEPRAGAAFRRVADMRLAP